MKKSLILIVFGVIVLCAGNYLGQSMLAQNSDNEKDGIPDVWFDFWLEGELSYLMDPPASADSFNVFMLSLYLGEPNRPFGEYHESPRLNMDSRMFTIYKDSNNLYVPFYYHQEPHQYYPSETEYIWKTLRGEIKGDSLVFKNNDRFGSAPYTGFVHFSAGRKEGYSFGYLQNDTINVCGANIDTDYIRRDNLFSSSAGTSLQSLVSYGYYFTGKDVVYEYNPETMLIRRPNSNILLSDSESCRPDYRNEYATDMIPMWGDAAIYELLAGTVSPREPESLPAPEFRLRNWNIAGSNESLHNVGVSADIRIDIVNPEGYLLNPDKLGFRIYYDGEVIHSSKCVEDNYWYLNPFYNHEKYSLELEGSFPCERPDLEVEWFYLKDDGTEVVSPRANSMDMDAPQGVTSVSEEYPNDFNTYDLTGRKVNPENLAPGIYIRNGRKFMVGKN